MVKKQPSVVSITELTGINEHNRIYESLDDGSRYGSFDEEFESFGPINSSLSHRQRSSKLLFLCFTSLGSIYGDISTSPLYTLNIFASGGDTSDIYGAVSVIFYLFTIIVLLKYLLIVIPYGCYKGEGGHLALYSKINISTGHSKLKPFVKGLSLLGCSLVVADGLLTPSTSILNAIQGISLPFPEFHHTLELSIVIIVGLMAVQRFGAHKISFVFSPIILLWLLTLAAIGVKNITKSPTIFWALNPIYGVKFLRKHGFSGISSLMLAITGTEALFLDVGCVGPLPVQLALGFFVYPCLMLNYFGQGAYLVATDPQAISNVFYSSIPVPAGSIAYWFIFILATLATIIASQALILGIFGIVHQLVELKFIPNIKVVHVSPHHKNLVYIPSASKVLTIGLVVTCLIFRDPDNITKAYGLGISIDFLITSVLTMVVLVLGGLMLVMVLVVIVPLEICLIYSSLGKLENGGWFTVVVCGVVILFLKLWN